MLVDRSLSCQRITLHKNLFCSYVLNSALTIIYLVTVVNNPKVVASNPVSRYLAFGISLYQKIPIVLSNTNIVIFRQFWVWIPMRLLNRIKSTYWKYISVLKIVFNLYIILYVVKWVKKNDYKWTTNTMSSNQLNQGQFPPAQAKSFSKFNSNLCTSSETEARLALKATNLKQFCSCEAWVLTLKAQHILMCRSGSLPIVTDNYQKLPCRKEFTHFKQQKTCNH